MKIILIEESYVSNPDINIVKEAIKYKGYAMLENYPVDEYYELISVNDDIISVSINHNIVEIKLDDILEIKQKLNKTIYKNEFSFTDGNIKTYDLNELNSKDDIVCKNNISVDGDLLDITIGKSYDVSNSVFTISSIDKRVKIGIKDDIGYNRTYDYEWHFKTKFDNRVDSLDRLFNDE